MDLGISSLELIYFCSETYSLDIMEADCHDVRNSLRKQIQ